MKYVPILAIALVLLPAVAGSMDTSHPGNVSTQGGITRPENLPQTIPLTAASLYRMMFELDRGMPYRTFVQTVPNAYTVREPADVVAACHRLGLKAEQKKARVGEVLAAPGPVLARNNDGNWILYRVRDGVIERIDGAAGTVTPTPESQFVQDWTGDLILVDTYSAEDYEKAPRIEFAETKHDFGKAWQGENLQNIFTFTNGGQSPLEITSVRASCGCTAAIVSKATGSENPAGEQNGSNPAPGGNPLYAQGHQAAGARQTFAPGESGSIKVTFRTAGKVSHAGSTVSVYSNDPRTPTTMLQVSANVLVPVEVRPTIVRFNRVGKGSDLQREVRIRAPNDPQFKILSVHGSNDKVSWDLEPVDEEIGENRIPSYILRVSVDISGANLGTTIRDTLVLKTNSKEKPVVSIPVEATVVGDLYLAPNSFTFTGNYPNRDLVRYAMLRNNSSRDIHIVEVRNNIDNLAVEVTPLEGGKHYRIKATLSVGDKPEPVEGHVVLVTDHPEQSEIDIPVTYILPEIHPPTGHLQQPMPGR